MHQMMHLPVQENQFTVYQVLLVQLYVTPLSVAAKAGLVWVNFLWANWLT